MSTPAVSPALAPPPGNPRFPLTDSLRALAVFAVVVTHVTGIVGTHQYASWGGFAVAFRAGLLLFFVVSGFLLYRPFTAARAHGRRPPSARRYGRRRVLRILPGYWFALTVIALLLPRLVPGVFTDDWWRYYGLLQIYDERTFSGGLGAVWSLCVEASFYLLLPLLAVALGRLHRPGRPPRRALALELAVLAGIAALSLAARVVVHFTGAPYWIFEGLPTLLWLFVAGMMLAVYSVRLELSPGPSGRVERLARERAVWCWAIAFALWLVTATALDPRDVPAEITERPLGIWVGNMLLAGTAAILVVLPAVVGGTAAELTGRLDPVRRLLANPALAWIGMVSYGIFLWHAPLMAELYVRGVLEHLPGPQSAWLLVLTLAVTVPVAALSYRIVELPFLRLKEGRSRGARPTPRAGAESARPTAPSP